VVRTMRRVEGTMTAPLDLRAVERLTGLLEDALAIGDRLLAGFPLRWRDSEYAASDEIASIRAALRAAAVLAKVRDDG